MPLVRRPLGREHHVGDLPAAPGERLLKLRLVVDVRRERVLDPGRERVDDRLLDRSEPVFEEERAEHRLEERREHVAVLRKPFDLLGLKVADPELAEPPAEVELARDDGTARTGDDVRADLREPPLGEPGVAVVELVRDRELEDAVAEELEALVRLDSVARPRRVRERNCRPVGRQRVDQRRERVAYWCVDT